MFCWRAEEILYKADAKSSFFRISLCCPRCRIRFVTHHQVTDADIDHALSVVKVK